MLTTLALTIAMKFFELHVFGFECPVVNIAVVLRFNLVSAGSGVAFDAATGDFIKYNAESNFAHANLIASLILKTKDSEQLIRKICSDSKDGGILVFLAKWDDINKAREKLLASSFFKNPLKFVVISLHSMVSSLEQNKFFKHPPPGCRKLVLSTNIAETAVTINDIVYVIDFGRMK
ncbi:hypothetical protein KIW84_064816 [Lathyrus oleraceus]|uniref:RNA helicase n=1 Tax=Pisum sativum TaxID=3888 RepID=A0A9D4WFD1_PEA|nr:hypothetical protein KIW84_064816 [Pisum sativum]